MRTVVGAGEFVSDISILEDGEHKFVVVRGKKGGVIVAYALLRQVGEDAEVEMLFSSERGLGYGQLALKTAEVVAKQNGAKIIWLDSVPKAASFYIHEGYRSADGVRFVKKIAV